MRQSSILQPRFIEGPRGKLFVVEFLPQLPQRGIVIFVPPFAEEMNRSRRMVNTQSRRLADLGYRVIVPDLYGTGDSHGDFGDVTMDTWLEDLTAVFDVIGNHCELQVHLWALRAGAFLAAKLLCNDRKSVASLVLWSPCTNGRTFINQFIRLRLLSAMIAKSDETESLVFLRSQLESGQSIEIAGYDLSAKMFKSIDVMDLSRLLDTLSMPISWFELTSHEGDIIPAPISAMRERLAEKGCDIDLDAAIGPRFWSTAEVSIAPNLVELTTNYFAKV